MQVSYKIIQMIGQECVVTKPTDIIAWAQAIGRQTYPLKSPHLRAELQSSPRIQGFCGPMYDGQVNGVPVVRYEDGPSNDLLSR